jgi:hypothetical protein
MTKSVRGQSRSQAETDIEQDRMTAYINTWASILENWTKSKMLKSGSDENEAANDHIDGDRDDDDTEDDLDKGTAPKRMRIWFRYDSVLI